MQDKRPVCSTQTKKRRQAKSAAKVDAGAGISLLSMRIRMAPTAGTALLLLVAMLCTTAPFVAAHGSLSQPKSRNVLQPIRGEAWWREHGNGVGEATTGPKPVNGPGVCGDPFQHYADASYYSNMSSQPIQATYTAGQAISVTWDITVNHGGRIGLKLCARRSNLNAACFNNYPLYRADIPTEKYTYIMAGGTGPMTARYLLPAGLTCTNGCMLQWEYLTMNSCFEACNRAVCGVDYAAKKNPVTGASNMADCCLGSTCPATTTVPEVFRNCADIKILAAGPMASPSPAPRVASPSPTPQASPSPKPQQASPSPKPPVTPPTQTSPSPAPAAVDNCTSQPGAARAACFCQGATVYKYYADTLNGCSGAMWCYAPGQSTYTRCPAGTLFSDARQYCDWPANVQCSATPPPPPSAPPTPGESPSPAPQASPSPSPGSPSPSPVPPASPSPLPGQYSALWGADGSVSDRLLDFSYAGYKQGQVIPSSIQIKGTVTDYGAVGDGVTDCTAAIKAAIAATNCTAYTPCALYFPAGRYVVSSNLTISKSLVLMGAGMDATTLFFPNSFENLYGNTANYALGQQSQWAFGPGMIAFKASDTISYTTSSSATLRSFITANATRGSYSVSVNNTSRLTLGQWIRITASDHPLGHPYAGKLIAYMYGNKLVSDWSDLVGETHIVQFLAKITGIAVNASITLDRPLPYDLDIGWLNVTVHAWNPSSAAQDMGIADMSIEFPNSGTYPGHFREKGYNGIFFNNAVYAFAKNVRIINADFSLGLMRCYFSTLSNIVIDANYDRGVSSGHHGIEVSRGRDNLVTDCNFKAKQVHDFTYGWWTTATVLRRATGTDLNIDFHRSAPYGNLVTDTYLGAATRPFAYGGSSNRGPNAGSWQTFWNLRGRQSISLPAGTFGPDLNFVAINSSSVASAQYNWYKEDISNSALVPQDLYQAMLEKRLGTA